MCRTKKDMRIWVEQLQSHNTSLVACSDKPHRTPCYIQKMRLQYTPSMNSMASLVDQTDSAWLGTASYTPGDVALMFQADSPSILFADFALTEEPSHES